MTDIEKAIKRIKSTKDYLLESYREEIKACKFEELKPLITNTFKENVGALNLAIQTLQEKAEREKGCECCEDESVFDKDVAKYCFSCGRKLGEDNG